MKKILRFGCLFLAALILLPLLAATPVDAAGFGDCIIDTSEGDPVWGRPILVVGEDADEDDMEELMAVLGIDDPEEETILIIIDQDTVELIGDRHLGYYSTDVSCVLIQNQEEGHGIEFQNLTPDDFKNAYESQFVLAAYSLGLRDVKIVVASPREDIGAEAALAGLFLAAEYDAPPFIYTLTDLNAWQTELFARIKKEAKGDKEDFAEAVDELCAWVILTRHEGLPITRELAEEKIYETFEAIGMTDLPEDHVKKLAKGYARWDRTPLGEQARMRSIIDPEEGDPIFDKPILTVGEDIEDEMLDEVLEMLHLKDNKDLVDIMEITEEDVRKYVHDGIYSRHLYTCALIQNQEPGYGVEVQVLNPEFFDETSAEVFRIMALTAGIRDAKLVIAGARRDRGQFLYGGYESLAGILKAYDENGLKLTKKDRKYLIKEYRNLFDLVFYPLVHQKNFELDLYDRALGNIFDKLLEGKANGKKMNEEEIREIFESELEAVGQLKYLQENRLTEVIEFFRDWYPSKRCKDVGPLRPQTELVPEDKEDGNRASEEYREDPDDFDESQAMRDSMEEIVDRIKDLIEDGDIPDEDEIKEIVIEVYEDYGLDYMLDDDYVDSFAYFMQDIFGLLDD